MGNPEANPWSCVQIPSLVSHRSERISVRISRFIRATAGYGSGGWVSGSTAGGLGRSGHGGEKFGLCVWECHPTLRAGAVGYSAILSQNPGVPAILNS